MKDQIIILNIILTVLLFSLMLNLIGMSNGATSNLPNSNLSGDRNSSYRTSAFEGTVAIIQDVSPGSYPGKELTDILDSHSISYVFFNSNDLGIIDLSPYSKVILSGNQPPGFATNLTTIEIAALEDYVSAGGSALIMPDNDAFGALPGGGTYSSLADNKIVEVDSTHPVMTTPNAIDVIDLQNLDSSAAGFIFSIPGSPNFILENGAMAPIMYELTHGLGNIMVSTLPLERIHGTDISLLFENAVLFTPLLVDTDNPVVSSPDDIDLEVGSTGNFIVWKPVDENPDTYTIDQNLTQIAQGSWSNNTEISLAIDGLSVGNYQFKITIKDIVGNAVSDLVIVRVVDSIKPSLNSPNNITYEFGSTGNTLTWVATDSSPANYSVFKNNQQVANGFWTSGQSIIQNIDGLSLGNYNYTLHVEDGSGQVSSDEVMISVVDTTGPTGTGPEDFVIKIGTEGVFLNWTIDDLLPNKYTLFENETVVAEGEWTTDNSVLFELKDMELGHNLYVLKANDTSGNEFVDQVNVTVVLSDFYISSPSDIFYLEGKSGHSITWITNSLDPWYFIITRNDEVIKNETWINDIIIINVDDLKPGDHNFTLELHNKKDKILTDSVLTRVFPDLISGTIDAGSDNLGILDGIFKTDNRFLFGGAAAITVIGGISFYARRK